MKVRRLAEITRQRDAGGFGESVDFLLLIISLSLTSTLSRTLHPDLKQIKAAVFKRN